MIKLTFEFQGELGEIELQQLAGYRDRDDILDSIGTSESSCFNACSIMQYSISDVDPTPQMYACVRGERNVISPSSEAARLGFTKLIAVIDGKAINILV